MIDDILCSVSGNAIRIALREDGGVVELFVEPVSATTLIGSVHLGRVTKVLRGMGACFVDIGLDRAGFLPLPGARDAAIAGAPPALHEGATVLAQVLKDPQGGKGAELSLTVNLPGRHLVYAPRQPGVVFSRRIADAAERARLAAILAEVAQPGEGFILRTAAVGATRDDLARDAAWLRAAWSRLCEAASSARPPACLWRDLTPLARILRDRGHGDLRRVLTDHEGLCRDARDYCRGFLPQLAEVPAVWREPVPLFDRFGVEDEIDAALRPRAGLPSGGFLMIEPSHALTAIDVNTGRHVGDSAPDQTILVTNLEAAREVARQVRLRNLSGLIVVDFVHMQTADQQARVRAAVDEAFAADPVFVRIGGFTALGLFEIARRRSRPPLREILMRPCDACDGEGWNPSDVPAPRETLS